MSEDTAPVADRGPLLRIVKHQPIAFALVGVVNTAIGYGLFVIWMLALGNDNLYAVALIGSYSISVLIAFVLHRTLVFRVRGTSPGSRGVYRRQFRWARIESDSGNLCGVGSPCATTTGASRGDVDRRRREFPGPSILLVPAQHRQSLTGYRVGGSARSTAASTSARMSSSPNRSGSVRRSRINQFNDR